jgi:hypothetical protein
MWPRADLDHNCSSSLKRADGCAQNFSNVSGGVVNPGNHFVTNLPRERICIKFPEDQEGMALRAFLDRLFPRSRWKITAKESRLNPYFTAANMVRINGLKIEWPTSLQDHLRHDRRRKALQVLPYKCYLQSVLSGKSNSGSQDRSAHGQFGHGNHVAKEQIRFPIPNSVLIETTLSLDVLSPAWERRTNELLEEHIRSFPQIGPLEVSRTLNLIDFSHWKERLFEVYEVFQSPPSTLGAIVGRPTKSATVLGVLDRIGHCGSHGGSRHHTGLSIC